MSEDIVEKTLIIATPAEYRLVYRIERTRGKESPFLEIELTQRGIEQAEQLGAFLQETYGVDRIVYTRAEECRATANIVAECFRGVKPAERPELITRTGIEEKLIDKAIEGLEIKGPKPPIKTIRGGIPTKNGLKNLMDEIETDPATYLIIATPDVYHLIGKRYQEKPALPRTTCNLQIHLLVSGVTGRMEAVTRAYNFAINVLSNRAKQKNY